MDTEIIIQKKNTFVDAIYKLSLDEMRIFNYAIAKTNPFKEHNFLQKISINDLVRFYNLDNKKDKYKQFNEALNNLFNRQITYTTEDTEHGRLWVTSRLIVNKIENKNGVIGLKFSDEINQLIKCDRAFLEYKLRQTIGITSPNSVRIYEMLLYTLKTTPKGILKKEYSITDIKQKLGLSNKYPRFSNFKKDVLEVAKKQINKHTDIKINYTIKKLGRVPQSIIFIAKYKPTADNFHLEKEQENIQEISKIELPKPTIEQQEKSLNYLQKIQKTLKK